MTRTYKWCLHRYLGDSREGLFSKLELTQEQDSLLKHLRKQSRSRVRETFSDVQGVFQAMKRLFPDEHSQVWLKEQIRAQNSFRHVDDDLVSTIVKLAANMGDDDRRAFLRIRPKFRTQGSYQYQTINSPYRKPPQEMDIDDGVYFPMQMFEGFPKLAHRLMIALVDSALKSLADENVGWEFDNSKPTCARIRIKAGNVHLDVPMYAIPEDKYLQIEESLKSVAVLNSVSMDAALSYRNDGKLIEEARLDPSSVLLARRDREKWQKSDPQVVQKWFTDSVDEIGEHLRLACRFLKGWRDVVWETGGGISSITLMKCAVDTLGQSLLDGKDLGLVMKEIAENLVNQLTAGVESPDYSDDRPLFPNVSEHNEVQRAMVDKARAFSMTLNSALTASSKEEASELLRSIFGERGISSVLITSVLAAPVYATPAEKSEPAQIEETMTSG